MAFRHSHRFSVAALLVLALLLQGLLPAWAAARAQSHERWVEVCSVAGLQWVKADPSQGTVSHASGDHCAMCSASGALPDFDLAPYLRSGLSQEAPLTIRAQRITAFPGHALRSRAPPSFS